MRKRRRLIVINIITIMIKILMITRTMKRGGVLMEKEAEENKEKMGREGEGTCVIGFIVR